MDNSRETGITGMIMAILGMGYAVCIESSGIGDFFALVRRADTQQLVHCATACTMTGAVAAAAAAVTSVGADLSREARDALAFAGITVADWVAASSSDGRWYGDRCGCIDDRCTGHHHPEHQPCSCLPSLIDDYRDRTGVFRKSDPAGLEQKIVNLARHTGSSLATLSARIDEVKAELVARLAAEWDDYGDWDANVELMFAGIISRIEKLEAAGEASPASGPALFSVPEVQA